MRDNKYNYKNQTGMYREKITINERTVGQDEMLQEIEIFNPWGAYWAMLKTFQNNESIDAGQEQTKHKKRFVVKYSKSLDGFVNAQNTSFEVIHKGITYDVKEVVNDNGLNETITIYCEGRG